MTTLIIILIALVLLIGTIGGGSYDSTPHYSEFEYFARLEYRQRQREARFYTLVFIFILFFLLYYASSIHEVEKITAIHNEYNPPYRN